MCGWPTDRVSSCELAINSLAPCPGTLAALTVGAASPFHLFQGMEGLSFGKREAKLGWNAQPTTAVMLDDVRVPEVMRLGQVRGRGQRYCGAALSRGLGQAGG